MLPATQALQQDDAQNPAMLWVKDGQALWSKPDGEAGKSCASCRDCHDNLSGRKLGGNPIPQGHATGYPIYRLEWQSVGSLQRRLRGCMTAVRAAPYSFGASELVELEAFLGKRGAGMMVDAPAVRP